MKKIFYFIAAIGIAWGIVSCDNEPKNPGDFSIDAYLTVGDIVSQKTGEVYPLNVAYSCDTVFFTSGTVKDTVFDASGNIVEINSTPVYAYSDVTTHFIEFEPVTFPFEADTFAIDISTNSKWVTQKPKKVTGNSEFYCMNLGGGGNGTFQFRSIVNINYNRTRTADFYIYTSDSTVMVKIPCYQLGMKGE